ncbi:hypothetical protein BDQ12DRAFT_236985 [Crucibulum laeve]|uniref:CDP-diacylglycerol--glycerol-3-phosphate 3-phosphatidyltransferase n=1 Tax=Crucibulum laeve TaxID=68775 RepID=A0A5C3LX25_9AGAR|nr:hypothetical protein BDQ12DRAFT_236985 [Crucibulum laeve]
MLRISSTAARRTRAAHDELWCSAQRCRRFISISQLDPSIRDFTAALARKQPAFSISPNSIRILSKPPQFYDLLLDMIRRAERRIFISSLYIGSAESELISELRRALHEKSSLHLYLHLDLNRSTRPGASSTAKILLPLLKEYPTRVHVSMFRSPSLRGLLAKLVPPRFNEGWGTWHAKVYGVDDEIMISGANLNKSYFTNRQDRYLHFTDQHGLAQYCFNFLRIVAQFSFKLLPAEGSSIIQPHSYVQEDYVLQWLDPHTHPHRINQKAENAFTAFQSSHLQPSTLDSSSPPSTRDSNHAIIFPIIQAGQFNIREEETTFTLLFRHLNIIATAVRTRPLLDLTSGYFSLYKPYQDLILGSPYVDCKIVAAAPKANGFFGSNGISGRIPEGYTLYEQRFMKAVKKAGRLWKDATGGGGQGVQLSEWSKKGWTYHAKGIWLSPSPLSPPVLTLFGSTNLNSRSAHLDTELSFLMVIPSEPPAVSQRIDSSNLASDEDADSSAMSLRRGFAEETERIRCDAVPWEGGRRNVRFTTKLIVWLVKGML